jgi:predicted ribosomally synthesized peptide with nif11-like leader
MMEVTTCRQRNVMSEEQLKAFLEAVRADAGLQEKLKAAADADAVVAIAQAAGFVISANDLKKAQAELSDEELERVAGGTYTWDPIEDARMIAYFFWTLNKSQCSSNGAM